MQDFSVEEEPTEEEVEETKTEVSTILEVTFFPLII